MSKNRKHRSQPMVRTEEEPRWHLLPLGLRWPLVWRMVLAYVDDGVNYLIRLERQERETKRKALNEKGATLVREANIDACNRAVKIGEVLAELKRTDGPRGWMADVQAMGLTVERARKSVAIFWFSKYNVQTYEKSRFLGFEKVAQIARGLLEWSFKLLPPATIERGGEKTLVIALTDHEYREYVQSLIRRRPVPLWRRSVRDVKALGATVLRLKVADVPPDENVQDLVCGLLAAQAHLTGLTQT